jgi:hypothetical protein
MALVLRGSRTMLSSVECKRRPLVNFDNRVDAYLRHSTELDAE